MALVCGPEDGTSVAAACGEEFGSVVFCGAEGEFDVEGCGVEEGVAEAVDGA